MNSDRDFMKNLQDPDGSEGQKQMKMRRAQGAKKTRGTADQVWVFTERNTTQPKRCA